MTGLPGADLILSPPDHRVRCASRVEDRRDVGLDPAVVQERFAALAGLADVDVAQLAHSCTDRRHVVPIFQRPYVWEEERNWAPLWTDVKSAAEEVEAEQAGTPTTVDRVSRTHFLGAIVLERLPVAPGRIVAMNVIDGQQRLTTLQVLLAACRAAAKASGASNAEQLIRMLLNNTEQLIHPEHPEERYKVWPSLPDRDAFRDVQVTKLPPRAADDHQLVEARRYFDGELNTWLNEV